MGRASEPLIEKNNAEIKSGGIGFLPRLNFQNKDSDIAEARQFEG